MHVWYVPEEFNVIPDNIIGRNNQVVLGNKGLQPIGHKVEWSV